MSKAIRHISEYKGLDSYEVFEAEYIEEISSTAIRLRHKTTGAHILVLSNDNPYKHFDISFLTPAFDSTGLPHILEHCVLAGSERYPIGSYESLQQNTATARMNAATAADHTNFFFTAKDDAEYQQCLDLFLDGVFYPAVLDDENIFMREGWRFDFTETDDGIEIDYNGIVLNEMKAEDNDYARRIRERICRRLMPDSVYHNRSGGKSYKIPRLTYEALKEYHGAFYHPSNAYIYLYGDMDIEETLSFLDGRYLSRFSYREPVEIPRTPNEKKLVRSREKIHTDQEETRVYVYACLFDGKVRPEQAMAFRLFKNEIENIVGHQLSELGLDESVMCVLRQNCVQDRLEIHYPDNVEGAGKDVLKAIRRALRKDFDADNAFRAELMARLNRHEIRFWEAMYEKSTAGSYLFDLFEDYWFYDEAMLFDLFQVSDNLQYIKNRIWGSCFNTLITRELPEEGREIMLECIPENKGPGYFRKRMGRQLDCAIDGLAQEDLRKLHLRSMEYDAWADELEKKEESLTTALLQAEKKESLLHPPVPAYTRESLNGVTFFHLPVEQSKVAWLCLSFNADEFKDHVSELRLLVDFFNDRGFKEFYGLDSDEAKMLLTSRIFADVVVNRDFGENENETHVFADISAVMLEENIPDVIRLMHHMMFDVFIAVPFFEDRLDSRIRSLRNDFAAKPEAYFEDIAGSNVDERMNLLDRMEGLSYYRFLQMLKDNAPGSLAAFYKTCYAMLNRIFNNDRLTVYCSAAERGMTLVKKTLTEKTMEEVRSGMFASLEKDYRQTIRNTRNFEKRREIKFWRDYALAVCGNTDTDTWYEEEESGKGGNVAIVIPSEVNYIAYYGKLERHIDYAGRQVGAMMLAAKLLEEQYLRVALREYGGAYGYSARFYPSGSIGISSYRDPNLRETMQVILGSADYLRSLSISNVELELLKQSILEVYLDKEDNDPWGDQEDVRSIEIKNMAPDRDQVIVETIRACTVEDIREAADLVEEMLGNGDFCVIGCRRDIADCADLFEIIEDFEADEEEEEAEEAEDEAGEEADEKSGSEEAYDDGHSDDDADFGEDDDGETK